MAMSNTRNGRLGAENRGLGTGSGKTEKEGTRESPKWKISKVAITRIDHERFVKAAANNAVRLR